MKRTLPEHLSPEQKAAIRQNEKYEAEGLFIPATKNDAADYRQWARDNFQAEFDINPIWHPIVIDECINIIIETYNNNQ